MKQPRLLLDQGLPRGTAELLRQRSWQVLHVGEIGLHRSKDREILDYALKENMICVTLDADFNAILATSGADGPSTIRIRREGLGFTALANLLLDLWPKIDSLIVTGVMITVTAENIRIRQLPVNRDG